MIVNDYARVFAVNDPFSIGSIHIGDPEVFSRVLCHYEREALTVRRPVWIRLVGTRKVQRW